MDEVADRRRTELTLMDDASDRSRTEPSRSGDDDDRRRTELARMEAAAIEAGRWLRRTGRVSLPVRPRRRVVN